MNSDFYYCIGKTHTICQDYAEAGEGYAIISDGCSMAADSHIGALLLSRAAKASLGANNTIPDIFEDIKQRVASYAKLLDLSTESLYATLAFVKANERAFSVALYGDGVVAARKKDGSWWIMSREFKSNAPYYLAYQLDKGMENQYFSQFGAERIHRYYNSEGGIGEETRKIDSNDYFAIEFPYTDFDLIALLSDGVSSFQKIIVAPTYKRQESVPLLEILNEVLNFKNFNGQFVQRRCKAAFRKFADGNYVNLDDFSLGVLYHESVHQGEGSSC
jgi:hypothetical protein